MADEERRIGLERRGIGHFEAAAPARHLAVLAVDELHHLAGGDVHHVVDDRRRQQARYEGHGGGQMDFPRLVHAIDEHPGHDVGQPRR
ncbi:hypothetical protein D3C71_1750130 [compost metagenome]